MGRRSSKNSLFHHLSAVTDIHTLAQRSSAGAHVTTVQVVYACIILLVGRNGADACGAELECLLLTPLRIRILVTEGTHAVDKATLRVQILQRIAVRIGGIGCHRRSSARALTVLLGSAGRKLLSRPYIEKLGMKKEEQKLEIWLKNLKLEEKKLILMNFMI